ncbi:MAG: hypothetical protein C0604_08370 [Clostridiales bacterium]|nr:MAG: hypothetical protein C0604_08370 [Clostridiales bacterium]
MKNKKEDSKRNIGEIDVDFEDRTEAIKKLMPSNVKRHIGDGINALKSDTECLLETEPIEELPYSWIQGHYNIIC